MGRLKQSGFSLYELNLMKNFIDDWRYEIKRAYGSLSRLDVEQFNDDKITFSFKPSDDVNVDLDEFDDIATNCMPKILYTLIDWVGVDFGYQWTYGDNEPIDGYVYIDFVVW